MKSSIRLPRNYRRTMRGYLVKASWQRRKSGIFKGKSSFMNSKISYWNSKLLRMKSSRRDLKNRYGNRKRKSWLIGFKNYRMWESLWCRIIKNSWLWSTKWMAVNSKMRSWRRGKMICWRKIVSCRKQSWSLRIWTYHWQNSCRSQRKVLMIIDRRSANKKRK